MVASSLPAMRGTVCVGDQRGRQLGFPTANLAIVDGAGIDDGVWAGWCQRADGSVHGAALSLGRRATVYGTTGVRLLEAHLPGFDGDLYDEQIAVYLVEALRPQQRFESLDELTAQLRRDVAATVDWTRRHPWTPAAAERSELASNPVGTIVHLDVHSSTVERVPT